MIASCGVQTYARNKSVGKTTGEGERREPGPRRVNLGSGRSPGVSPRLRAGPGSLLGRGSVVVLGGPGRLVRPNEVPLGRLALRGVVVCLQAPGLGNARRTGTAPHTGSWDNRRHES